jgi:hypothetical protein
MTIRLSVLQCGQCETLKATVHATALGLAAIMGIYNGAAWLSRRDHRTHLAVNAVLYTVLTLWEEQHVAHHLTALKRHRDAHEAASRSDQPDTIALAA